MEHSGCERCWQTVLSAGQLPIIATSREMQARLLQCPTCGAYWVENERETHVIDDQEASRFPRGSPTIRLNRDVVPSAEKNRTRPSHGCYVCRRSVSHSTTESMKLIHRQHGCEPYPDEDVWVYECMACGGLYLKVSRCIMNLREEDARELFPTIKLDPLPNVPAQR